MNKQVRRFGVPSRFHRCNTGVFVGASPVCISGTPCWKSGVIETLGKQSVPHTLRHWFSANSISRCKVHAVHLCFGSSNCFRPSLTVVPSQDWEGSCLAKGAAAALQCALLFSCLRTSGAAATFFRIGSGASSGGLRVLCAKKNEVLHKSFVTNPWPSSFVSSLKSPFGLGYLFENATNDIGCRRFQGW